MTQLAVDYLGKQQIYLQIANGTACAFTLA